MLSRTFLCGNLRCTADVIIVGLSVRASLLLSVPPPPPNICHENLQTLRKVEELILSASVSPHLYF